jgi:hypothetical protein
MNENSNRRVNRIELGLWLQIDNLVRGLGLLLPREDEGTPFLLLRFDDSHRR